MRQPRTEHGFTLVELLVGLLIASLVATALASAFVTGLNTAQPAIARVQESNDAQLINTFLARDAQAAGGTDPATQTLDPSVGVSVSDDAGCATATPFATLELRFSWYDRTPTLDQATQAYDVVKHVANYYYVASLDELIRTTCTSGNPAPPPLVLDAALSRTLAHTIGSIDDVSCNPACSGQPSTVSITLTATNTAKNSSPAYTYTLTASLRPEQPPAGGVTGGSLPPLLLLGSRCTSSDHAVLDINGNGNITVNGDVYVNAPPTGCIGLHATDANFHATDSFVRQCPPSGVSNCFPLAVSLPDPYATLTPPPGVPAACTGTNPTPVGGVYPAGVYPQPLSLTGTASFATGGTFIFCQGVSLSGHASITGTNVLWYLQGGTLNVSGQANLLLTPAATGPYAGIVVWQPAANTTSPMSISGQGNISLQGTVYAPAIEVDVAGNGTTPLIEALIAGAVGVAGNGNVGIGIPITSPTSLQNWTANRPYPATTFTASGGQMPYSWSASGLPAGLSINAISGVLSGTPTATGTATAVVTVTDANGLTGNRKYTFTINPAPSISALSLPTWTVSRNYPGTALTVSPGTGTGPFTWSGSGLPSGLSINSSTGVVSGTPTATGTVSATFTVTDAAGATATRAGNVTINATPAITAPSSLQNWTQNVAYPATTISSAQGTTPYTWSASGLPSGMTINPNTGVLSGTPTVANAFTPTITVTDTAGATATKVYALTINNSVSISTTALPDWTINRPNYNVGVSSGGGTPPYTWTATGLPTGLTINAATGVISGTPTSLCSPCAINVNITDHVGASTSHGYNVNINAAPTITGPASLAPWTINRAYPGTTITATAGTPNYGWSATGLPSGMNINPATGVVSGTPTTLCSPCAITITVTDTAGASTTRNYSLTINPPPNITTSNLPQGEQNLAYSTTVSATAGTPNGVGSGYTWSASGLPAGLSINATTGTISGTSTSAGSFALTLTAKDAAGATASSNITLQLAVPPSITGPSILPNWTVNRPYPDTIITGAGGTAPFTWAATGLPSGITITPGGLISGTPTTAGTYASVNVKATDALGATTTHTYSIVISAAPTISTATLPNGEITAAYSATLTGTNGTTPYTWGSTTLPAGLNLNTNTGAITGTPTVAGTTNVTFTLTDFAGATASTSIAISVIPNPSVLSLTSSNQNGQPAQGETITITFSGPLQPSSICSAWTTPGSHTTSTTSTLVTLTRQASGHDILNVTDSTACTFNIFSGGSLDLGAAGYVTTSGTPPTTAIFGAPSPNCNGSRHCSAITIDATNKTLTITLGDKTIGNVGTVTTNPGITYTPSPTIRDTNGGTISGTASDTNKFF